MPRTSRGSGKGGHDSGSVLVGGKFCGIGEVPGIWPVPGTACGAGTPLGGGTGIVPARTAVPFLPS